MSVATQELLLAASDVRIEAAADKTPTVNILAYTGGLMVVPGWGPLVIDLAGIDVSASQVSILADHDASMRSIGGVHPAAFVAVRTCLTTKKKRRIAEERQFSVFDPARCRLGSGDRCAIPASGTGTVHRP